jgi:hypothetical protein
MAKKTLQDWQRLELERYDTSYRQFKTAPVPANHVCKQRIETREVVREVIPETMKQAFYHAGRFAAGARDRKAAEAYRELQRLGEL